MQAAANTMPYTPLGDGLADGEADGEALGGGVLW